MKNILLILFFTYSTLNLFAQNRIDSLKIIPTHITEDSNVSVVCYSYSFSYGCNLLSFTFSIDSLNIDVYAKHILGFGAADCNSVDTLQIGKFKKGIYELIYHRQTNIDTVLDTIYFEVFRGIGSPNGVSEDKNNLITIYPNPSKGTFYLNTELNYTKIEIVDVLGNSVFSGTEREKYFDVSYLKSGLYFIRLSSENNSIIKRLLILE